MERRAGCAIDVQVVSRRGARLSGLLRRRANAPAKNRTTSEIRTKTISARRSTSRVKKCLMPKNTSIASSVIVSFMNVSISITIKTYQRTRIENF